MKVGKVLYFPYSDTNGSIILDTVASAINLGFRHIEVPDFRPAWERDWFKEVSGSLKQISGSNQVSTAVHAPHFYELFSTIFNIDIFNVVLKQFKDSIDLARALKATVVTIHPLDLTAYPTFKLSQYDKDKARNKMEALLRKCSEYAKEMKIGLESFCWTDKTPHHVMFESDAEYMSFLEKIALENVGATIDAGHLLQHGVDPCSLLEGLKAPIFNVHIHDSDGSQAHLPLGEGKLELKNFLRRLKQRGYDGCVSLEVNQSKKKLQQSKKILEDTLKLI